jgi:hypothetical protein
MVCLWNAQKQTLYDVVEPNSQINYMLRVTQLKRNNFPSVLFTTTCFGRSASYHQLVEFQLHKRNC